MSNLADDLMAFVRRFVVMRDEHHLVVAAWIIHTYCLDAFEQTPYLAVTSPEKQCGKSRLLEVLEVLVHLPWMAVLPSEAVLYRKIDFEEPTLLLDEVDTIFNPKNAERYEAHRAILNVGHRRGAKVPRCVGASQDIAEFSAFSPKVLAGIGVLPETIADRSIPIRLGRKRKDEKVDRFLIRSVKPDAEALVEEVRSFAKETDLEGKYPEMPDGLSDRMHEGAECLVAIAEELDYADEMRAALVTLLSEERLDSQERMGHRLLRDLRGIFHEHRDGNPGMHTKWLIDYLRRIEEAPWKHYYGRRLQPNDLASLLKGYGVSPTTIRVGAEVAKGYKWDDLYPVWEQYLPEQQEEDDDDAD